jgi:hypothetical protein
MQINSTTLVQMCSKVAALSSNQANLATSDFLSFANLVISNLASEILAAREEYLIYEEPESIAAGQSAVRIPYRALNGIVRHLWWEDGSGSRFMLLPKAIESIEGYLTTQTGTPTAFYVQGNQIILLPTPNAAGTLQMSYPFRPNQLVDASTTQSISAVSTSSVTVPNIPSNFASGVKYDIIDHLSGNAIVYYDLVGTVSGSTISFSNNIPNAAVGNYIALANQSPVPMLPEEAHPLLLESTVLRVEMIRGNPNRIKNSAALVQDNRKAFDQLLANRIISKAHPTGGMSPHLPSGRRPY